MTFVTVLAISSSSLVQLSPTCLSFGTAIAVLAVPVPPPLVMSVITSHLVGSMANHNICTFQVEKELLLSLLSIESLPRSEAGGGDHQMIPELLNEVFLVK